MTRKCYFYKVYKSLLLIIQQVGNMVFFILFLRNMLCGVWADCKTDPVVCKKNKQRVRVVIKMFFVMGVSWIAEIISFFVFWYFGDDKKHILFYSLTPFQLFNSLQVCITSFSFRIIFFKDSFNIESFMDFKMANL